MGNRLPVGGDHLPPDLFAQRRDFDRALHGDHFLGNQKDVARPGSGRWAH